MRIFLSCIIFLFFSSSIFGQHQCGTPHPTQEQIDYVLNVQNDYYFDRNGGTTCIPLKAYVVRTTAGTGGPTNEGLNIMMSYLNHEYLEAGLEFYWAYLPSYHDDDDLFDYDGTAPDSDSEADLEAAFSPLVTDAVNIFFVDEIVTPTGFNAAGYAYFPCNSMGCNRILMDHDYVSATFDRGITINHELGHYFSLFHTFSGTSNGPLDPNAELVTRGVGANCATTGDLLCDTDADPEYDSADFDGSNCVYTGTAMDANGDTYNPLSAIPNIMSYYPRSCIDSFTNEQITRIGQGLVTRQGHTNYTLDASPMTVAAASDLMGDFTGASINLTWTDNAANEMGYLIEKSTTSTTTGFQAIERGATGENVTAFTDNDIAANTTYYYRVKASNGDCNSYSNVVTVMTLSVVCSASGLNGSDEYISDVQIGAINNPSGSDNYTDYYSIESTDLTIGVATAFTITNPGNAGGGGVGYLQDTCAIWIDWNQDGDFDDTDEQVVQIGGVGPYTGNITPPAAALAGTTRMRIRIHYNDEPTSPCGTTIWGEVEDYAVNIIAASANCGSETFDNSNLTGSYADNSYVGDNGVTWTYVESRNESSYGITGNGIMLRRSSEPSSLTSSSVTGGIGDFTCSLRKAFTGSGNRQVELFVNGVSQGTSIAWDNTAVQTFSVTGIDIAGSVSIEIRNITSRQVIVDDISWTCFAAPPGANPTVELSASSNAGNEAAASSITLTATASAAVSGDQTVTLNVSGTNITGTDYTNAATITILDGMTSGTTTFDVTDDGDNEITELAVVAISALSAGLDSGGVVSQNILITDNNNPSITVPAACSFESATLGGQYNDVSGFDGDTDHDLINNAGESDVDYLYSGAGEIGYDAFYLDGQGSDGLTDGDFVGVTDFIGDVGTYTDGSNGYQMSDLDGVMQLVFDPVTLAGFASYNVSVDYFVASSGYETTDYLRIYVVVDGGTELDLINTTGVDIDGLSIEGSWNNLAQDLSAYTTAQLIIEGSTNSSAEAFYFDNVQFTGSNTPMITVGSNSMNGFTYVEGSGPSVSQTNSVTWANLTGSVTSGNVVDFFEFSNDGGTTWNDATSLTFPIPPFLSTFGPVNVDVRLKEFLTAGTYFDTIVLQSSGAASVEVYLEGEVTAPTAACSELFISEYVEGSSNNKYLEIYNPTTSAVNLADYDVAIYFNGSTSVGGTPFALSGSLAAGGTFVIANNSASVWTGTPDLASGSLSFSGNDVVALRKLGSNIDLIGVIGDGSSFAQNQTLTRLSSIEVPTETYNAAEWTSSATDNVSGLGGHSSSCLDYVWTGTTDSDWDTDSNWSSGIVPNASDSVTIPDVSGASGNFPTITPATTTGNVSVDAGATLTVTTGIVLNGTLTNNGLVLLSDGAYLDDFTNSGSSYVGDITVETVAANGVVDDQRFISSPVNTPDFSEIADDLNGPFGAGAQGTNGVAITVDDCNAPSLTPTSNYGNLFELNETIVNTCGLDAWVVRSSGSLENGRGYSAYLANGSTFDFSGTPNTGNVSIAATNSGSAVVGAEGWNLLGNPYPSPISRDAVIVAGASDVQYFETSGVYQGSFTPYLPTSNIAIAQGFQVQVSADATINFDNSFRNTNSATWYAGETWFEYKLEVSVFGEEFADRTIVFFNNEATNGYEPMFDCEKRKSSIGHPTLATTNNGLGLALNGYNVEDLGETIPMSLEPGAIGNFTLNFEGKETFPENTTIYLKDLMTNTIHNIADGDYTFSAHVKDNTDRFEIIFVPAVEFVTTAVDCKGTNGTVQSLNENSDRTFEIVANSVIETTGNVATLNESLPEGSYIVNVFDDYGGNQTYAISIEALETIVANFEISATEIEVGETINLENSSSSGTQFHWNIEGNTISNVNSFDYSFENAGVYEVSLQAATEDCNDVKLVSVIVNEKSVTGISQVSAIENIKVFTLHNEIVVDITNTKLVGKTNIDVYNLLGQVVANSELVEEQVATIAMKNASNGYYFVKVLNGSNFETFKVYIK